jgi:phosphoglycolate phosphatase
MRLPDVETMQLIIFDCDGTLVDSQHKICAAMTHAFTIMQLPVPPREAILAIVGLSLPQAFAVLAAKEPASVQAKLADLYRLGFPTRGPGTSLNDLPYAGIPELVATLARRPELVLGIATGKSRRGVARILEREGWSGHFVTIQTADDHPSKPDPAMILQAMAEVGAAPARTIMVGDTTYDMEMALHAGVRGVGVSWGYHAPARLLQAGAERVVQSSAELLRAVTEPAGVLA